MATSYTKTIGLAKQGSGENANTWGTILNDGVFDLVDNAFSTNVSSSIKFNSATSLTLTEFSGAPSQSRLSVIQIVSGTLVTANTTVSLIVPTFQVETGSNGIQWGGKMYVIRNPNVFNVKVKQAASDGTTIPPNSTMGVLVTPATVVPLFAGFDTLTTVSYGGLSQTISPHYVKDVSIGVSSGDPFYTGHRPSFNFGDINTASISGSSFRSGVLVSVSASLSASFHGPVSVSSSLNVRGLVSVGGTFFVSSSSTFTGQVSLASRSIGVMTCISVTTGEPVAIDFSKGNFFKIHLGADTTVHVTVPTNSKVGQAGLIYLIQDTSGAVLNFPVSCWKFPDGATISKTASAGTVDAVAYFIREVSASTTAVAIDLVASYDYKNG